MQQIHDFSLDWTKNQKEKYITRDDPNQDMMGFYRETWVEMEKFNSMVEKVPSQNSRSRASSNSILIDTVDLRKYLQDVPKMVISSIKHNVSSTMETEIKFLKDDLTKTFDILV
jgi:hypothetical protein